MPITLRFENGNVVDIYPKRTTGLFTAELNGKSKRLVSQTADELVSMLEKLRKVTCVITSWEAIQ